ncbi:MAG: helix-turn-helix domain-containing protein [Spirochaetaceae bacterium]|jgi:transcriptional regulator with XRE-family HTH domain|nr:helix-turn-helix domain-containing protein [Spirochaetaceae bacterium]
MDRIRRLRKYLGLTQKDFAEKIQLKGNAISMLEQGRCALTEQNIRLMCVAFGVSERWLRTGEGDMFIPEKAVGAQELLDTYRELYPENKKFVLTMIKQLLETQRAMTPGNPPAPGDN